MNDWFIKLFRSLLEWEWYDDMNVKILFIHLLLKANFKTKKWRGIEIKKWELLTSNQSLAMETQLSLQQVRTCLKKLKSTWEITHKTTNNYTLIKLNNYERYNENNTPFNTQITDEQQTNNIQITTTKERKESNKERNINNNIPNGILENETFSNFPENENSEISVYENSESSELEEKDLYPDGWKSSAKKEKEETEVTEYGNKEINNILAYLQKIIGISDFKESRNRERRYAKHILDLWKKIWKEDFNFRLKSILEDEFKAKNCNSIKFLYWEIKSFIHSPIVEIQPKSSKKITFW